ncbi:MAG: DinB family protein [Chitinophagaceae bacterium]|nr:MAG: DinB family protein [Chitinophagaceae bacterium]
MAESIERWLAGPVEDVPSLLQPVAHALIQASKEIRAMMTDFPEEKLYEKPAGLASPGFHLKHMRGVLDRLFIYASNNQLSPAQLAYLKSETEPNGSNAELLQALEFQVGDALKALAETDEATLTQFRGVGRKQLPSTVIGLLVHAAEHTMRHTGQLLVTTALLKYDGQLSTTLFKP